jgi:hypothetical protein
MRQHSSIVDKKKRKRREDGEDKISSQVSKEPRVEKKSEAPAMSSKQSLILALEKKPVALVLGSENNLNSNALGQWEDFVEKGGNISFADDDSVQDAYEVVD